MTNQDNPSKTKKHQHTGEHSTTLLTCPDSSANTKKNLNFFIIPL